MIYNNEEASNKRMITYKLMRITKDGRLFPLFVDSKKEMKTGKWLTAEIGQLADGTHVKSKIGSLSLRPGFHSTKIPFADWIGKKGKDGLLYQAPDTVWCECTVEGEQVHEFGKNGLRTIPNGWYYFKTNKAQIDPWIISDKIKIERILSDEEVKEICVSLGHTPQPRWTEEVA